MFDYTKSRELYARACKVIPSGIYGHKGPSGACYTPVEAWPFFSSRAEGTYFWDVDGNRFIDYMCGYGPNILGYHDPDVDAAAAKITVPDPRPSWCSWPPPTTPATTSTAPCDPS